MLNLIKQLEEVNVEIKTATAVKKALDVKKDKILSSLKMMPSFKEASLKLVKKGDIETLEQGNYFTKISYVSASYKLNLERLYSDYKITSDVLERYKEEYKPSSIRINPPKKVA